MPNSGASFWTSILWRKVVYAKGILTRVVSSTVILDTCMQNLFQWVIWLAGLVSIKANYLNSCCKNIVDIFITVLMSRLKMAPSSPEARGYTQRQRRCERQWSGAECLVRWKQNIKTSSISEPLSSTQYVGRYQGSFPASHISELTWWDQPQVE